MNTYYGCPICHKDKPNKISKSTMTTLAAIIHPTYLFNEPCSKGHPVTIHTTKSFLLSYIPCTQCDKERLRNRYIKQATNSNNSITTLYLVKLYNDNESFYKAGLTFESVVSRFKTVPYNLEIITSITGDAVTLYDLEQKIHDYHKEQNYSYTPTKEFSGMSECFLTTSTYIAKLNNKLTGYSL